MIAIDTNILVRYLLNDDRAQAKAASEYLACGKTFSFSPTVLLELVWVLQANDCTREEILNGLRHILGLPNIRVREIEAVTYAIRWYEAGLDFADALHLALSDKDEGFLTFDKTLVKRAGKINAFPPVMDRLEDIELADVVQQRRGQKRIRVKPEDL